MNNDSLGDRMKRYENATRYVLPPRTYTVVRVDGKAFHSFTAHCEKPYDYDLMDAIQWTARFLFENMQGVLLTYQQSDEISVVMQDFKTHGTEPWMGGVVQKQASIAASMATVGFNYFYENPTLEKLVNWAMFDARTYTIPSTAEVANYLIWRQQDATRNSISMAAQAQFSHRQLHGVSSNQQQEMLWREKNINWDDYPTRARRGSVCYKETYETDVEYSKGDLVILEKNVTRTRTKIDTEIPIFTGLEGRVYLSDLLAVEEE